MEHRLDRMIVPEPLATLLRQYDGKFCVAARRLTTGEEILYHADELCPTASVFKIPVLIELLRRIDQGDFSLSQPYTIREDDWCPGSGVLKEITPGATLTIRDLAVLMIIVSDNLATDILVGMLDIAEVERTTQSLGFVNTHLKMGCKGLIAHSTGVRENWPAPEQVREVALRMEKGLHDPDAMTLKGVPENNSTTPLDMINLMERLYKGQVLGQKADSFVLDIMGRQQIKERIPALLPPGTRVANKTGALGGRILNDVGLVFPQKTDPYAVAIFTDQDLTPELKAVPAKISLAIYESFQRKQEER